MYNRLRVSSAAVRVWSYALARWTYEEAVVTSQVSVRLWMHGKG